MSKPRLIRASKLPKATIAQMQQAFDRNFLKQLLSPDTNFKNNWIFAHCHCNATVFITEEYSSGSMSNQFSFNDSTKNKIEENHAFLKQKKV